MRSTYRTGRKYYGLEEQQAGAVRVKCGVTVVFIVAFQKAGLVDDGEERMKELKIVGHKLVHDSLRRQAESPFSSQILYVFFIQPGMLNGPRVILIILRNGQQRGLAVRGKAAKEGIMRNLMQHGMLRNRSRHRRWPGRIADPQVVAQRWRLFFRLILAAPLLASLDKTVEAIELAFGARNAGFEHVAADLASAAA